MSYDYQKQSVTERLVRNRLYQVTEIADDVVVTDVGDYGEEADGINDPYDATLVNQNNNYGGACPAAFEGMPWAIWSATMWRRSQPLIGAWRAR
jgi:hypothetical protein